MILNSCVLRRKVKFQVKFIDTSTSQLEHTVFELKTGETQCNTAIFISMNVSTSPQPDGDKPIRNFLDDPRRSGPAPDTDRKEGSRRHVRNWGGLDFDNVKTGTDLEKEWTVSNVVS